MTETITCSYERCAREAWKPVEGEEPFCIFHSPKIDEKREAFGNEWNKFLEKHRGEQGKLFNLRCRGFIFPDNVDFSGVGFSGHTYFIGAVFSRHTYFNGASFSGHIYFNDAKFRGKTYFNNAVFSGKTYFNNAVFSLNAEFNNASFLWDTFFNHAVFLEESGFDNVLFSGETHFAHTTFSMNTAFNGASFSNIVRFLNTSFKREGFFTNTKFIGADLSNSTFTGCSFRNVMKGTHYTLKQVSWEKPAKWWHFWEYKKRREPIPPTDFTDIATSGIIAASNRQFVRDIEDQQFIVQFKDQHKFLYYAWLITCDCGRSFWRFLFWCIVVAGSFGFVYMLAGEHWFDNTGEWNTLTPFYYSFVTFLRLGFGSISPRLGSGWAQLTVTFEVFVGYIGLGGLISIFSNILARRA